MHACVLSSYDVAAVLVLVSLLLQEDRDSLQVPKSTDLYSAEDRRVDTETEMMVGHYVQFSFTDHAVVAGNAARRSHGLAKHF